MKDFYLTSWPGVAGPPSRVFQTGRRISISWVVISGTLGKRSCLGAVGTGTVGVAFKCFQDGFVVIILMPATTLALLCATKQGAIYEFTFHMLLDNALTHRGITMRRCGCASDVRRHAIS